MNFLNVILIIAILIVVPLVVGCGLAQLIKEYMQLSISAVVFWYLIGTFTMWAVYELISVPLIIIKSSFSVTVIVWTVLMLVVTACLLVVAVKAIKEKTIFEKATNENSEEDDETKNSQKNIVIGCLIFAIAILLIGFQCYKYAFKMHIDDDDSRFIVNAVEAYENGTLLTTNPATGIKQDILVKELRKDVVSPWMIYVATISKLVGMHPTAFAHTVLPVVLLLMSYMAYWLIGAQVFKESKIHCAFVLLFSAIINMFFSDTTHTQSYVTLVRLWQGKAIVAAITIPVLMAFVYRLFRTEKSNGMFAILFITSMASCLLSGMGIYLSGIIVGTYGFYNCLVSKKYKSLIGVVIACIPTIIYGMLYYFIGR